MRLDCLDYEGSKKDLDGCTDGSIDECRDGLMRRVDKWTDGCDGWNGCADGADGCEWMRLYIYIYIYFNIYLFLVFWFLFICFFAPPPPFLDKFFMFVHLIRREKVVNIMFQITASELLKDVRMNS